jgi:hypothetical protein
VLELLFSSGILNLGEQDEGSNAMFIKKPLTDYTCAACEAQVDHKTSRPAGYNNWKKMPYRDPLDRLAQAGIGFSRKLQAQVEKSPEADPSGSRN